MTNQASALVYFHFWNAICSRWWSPLDARLVSVARSRTACEALPARRRLRAQRRTAKRLAAGDEAHAIADGRSVDDVAADQRRLRTRLMVVYAAGGAAAAAVSAALFLIALGDPLYPVRTFAIWYIYCWPIVRRSPLILAAPQRRALLAFGGYVLVGG